MVSVAGFFIKPQRRQNALRYCDTETVTARQSSQMLFEKSAWEHSEIDALLSEIQ